MASLMAYLPDRKFKLIGIIGAGILLLAPMIYVLYRIAFYA